MTTIINPAQKDVILDYLISRVEVGNWLPISTEDGLCGFSPNETKGIIEHFIRRGLLNEERAAMGVYVISMKIEAHDFKLKGGFYGEKLLFENTVEKLLLEIDKLNPSDVSQKKKIDLIKENIKDFISVLTNLATIGDATKNLLS